MMVGIFIIIINVIDKDIGVNVQLKFFIVSGNDDGIFEFNEISGELFIVKSFDYDEEFKLYKVRENYIIIVINDFVYQIC